MKKLVLNSGSSSLKYKLFSDTDSVLSTGEIKDWDGNSVVLMMEGEEQSISNEDWSKRLEVVLKNLIKTNKIESLKDISHFIHRVVHGGEEYVESMLVSKSKLLVMKLKLADLAPLHNPYVFEILENCMNSNPDAKQIVVFDTAFGKTIPKENYLYALPIEYYRNYGIRRYSFHGISHKYVSESYHNHIKNEYINYTENKSKKVDFEDIKIVSLHLGSGCSACGIKGTQCVDTSFGYTPEENIVMATRIGEIDYSAVLKIKSEKAYSDKEIFNLLNRESGLLGVSGYTKDMKKILDDRLNNENAQLALDLFINSVVKQVMNMVASLNGIDVLIFTGGIGQRSDIVRQMICERLGILGVYIDVDRNVGNQNTDNILNITGINSEVEIYVIPTDEEREMLNESKALFD